MLSQVFGISRQAYYQREVRLAKYLEEKETILELIKPIRKKMHRFGSVKLYDKIKNDILN